MFGKFVVVKFKNQQDKPKYLESSEDLLLIRREWVVGWEDESEQLIVFKCPEKKPSVEDLKNDSNVPLKAKEFSYCEAQMAGQSDDFQDVEYILTSTSAEPIDELKSRKERKKKGLRSSYVHPDSIEELCVQKQKGKKKEAEPSNKKASSKNVDIDHEERLLNEMMNENEPKDDAVIQENRDVHESPKSNDEVSTNGDEMVNEEQADAETVSGRKRKQKDLETVKSSTARQKKTKKGKTKQSDASDTSFEIAKDDTPRRQRLKIAAKEFKQSNSRLEIQFLQAENRKLQLEREVAELKQKKNIPGKKIKETQTGVKQVKEQKVVCEKKLNPKQFPLVDGKYVLMHGAKIEKYHLENLVRKSACGEAVSGVMDRLIPVKQQSKYSLTGEVCHANKKKPVPPKLPLPKKVRDVILQVIKNYYSISDKDIEKKIRNKLNNAKRYNSSSSSESENENTEDKDNNNNDE